MVFTPVSQLARLQRKGTIILQIYGRFPISPSNDTAVLETVLPRRSGSRKLAFHRKQQTIFTPNQKEHFRNT